MPAPSQRAAAVRDSARTPDRGQLAIFAWPVLLLAFAAVASIQLFLPAPPPPAPDPTVVPPPDTLTTVSGQVAVLGSDYLADPDQQALDQLAGTFASDADKLRLAILAGEMYSPADALERLDVGVGPERAWPEPLDDDAQLVRRAYRDGSSSLSVDERQQLIDHHAWFGELLLVHDADEPTRDDFFGKLLFTAVAAATFAAVLGFGLFVGFALLILWTVLVATSTIRLRYQRPYDDSHGLGSLYLETAAAFIAGFLVLKVAIDLMNHLYIAAGFGDKLPTSVALAMQWSLAAVIFWPLVRGEKFADWGARIGWHKGSGWIKEIIAGLVGYIACIPLFLGGAGITLILSALFGPDEAAQPNNAPIELIANLGTFELLLFVSLATIWAPIVEETVFRGALFRHISGWGNAATGTIAATIITTIMFAAMHGYGVLFLPPLMGLAIGFSLLRLWRGSIIAAVVAHAAHNSLLMGVMITLVSNS